MRFSLLGGGRWGSALAVHLGRLGHEVIVFDKSQEVVELINKGRHPYQDMDIPKGVRATANLEEALNFSQYLVIALPVQAIRSVLSGRELMGKKVISASKGLEISTFKRVSEVLKEIEPSVEVFILSGPSFASEVSKGLPTALVLAGEDEEELRRLRGCISSESFRVYISKDPVGVELGGALKNVYAIACGISDGLGFGENARAGLITRSLAEMVRIGTSLGAKKETFYGLSGLGDLVLTSISKQSRNHTFGYLLGRGSTVEQAMKELNQTVEGYYTTLALRELTSKLGIYAPIAQGVYKVLYEGLSPKECAHELLRTPPQSEFE
mgnify:CR=1 FL=1